MPQQTQRHYYRGEVHEFPAGWPPEKVAAALASLPAPEATVTPVTEDATFGEEADETPGPVGRFLAGARSELPILDAVRHPIDTARGVATGITRLPAAIRAEAARQPGLSFAEAVGRTVVRPSVENVAERAEQGDTAGAIGAGATALAANVVPWGRVTGKLGRGMANTGARIASNVLDVPEQLATPVLKEGFLKWGPAAGRRAAEGQSLEAAATATATAPSGMTFTSKPGARPQTPTDLIQRGETRRLEALDEVKAGARPNVARAATPRGRGQYWRDQVRPVLPPEGQAAIDRISTLDPITATLASAPTSPLKGGLLSDTLATMMNVGRGTAGAAAHRLDRVGGALDTRSTSRLMEAMQRAALLARLMGQDDDQ